MIDVQLWSKLFSAARADDSAAQERLLTLTDEFLRSIVQRKSVPALLRSKISDSDLVQGTLLEIVRDFKRLQSDDAAAFRDWARRILLNNRGDACRKFLASQRCDVTREEGLDTAVINPQSGTPSGEVRRIERDELLERAIAQLPEHASRVIKLRHSHGLAWQQVGQQMGISPEAARKLWARAIKQLQQRMINAECSFE